MTARRPAALVRGLLPIAFTLGVAWWAFRSVDHRELAVMLSRSNLSTVAVAMAGFGAVFASVEVLGFGLSWRSSLDATMPWAHVRALVLGKQPLSVLFPPLTKGIGPLYFGRRDHSALQAFSASEVISTAEWIVVLAALSMVRFFTELTLPPLFDLLLGASLLTTLAVALWLWSPWFQAVLPRWRTSRLFFAFVHLGPRQWLTQLGLRLGLHAFTLGVLAVLLSEIGISLSWSQLLAFGPLFLFAGSLPLSMGAFGAPQAVALAVLYRGWWVASPAEALAFSVLWSAGYLAVQVVFGLAYFPRMVRLLREPSRA